MTNDEMYSFVMESNRIEGIRREPTQEEIAAHYMFLGVDPEMGLLPALEYFVSVVQPGAKLRRHSGMNVRVGDHFPIHGGPHIEADLKDILKNERGFSPYKQHQLYETLHPFMDGNGRSGRVLWLKAMGGEAPLGFLHMWYYQSLRENGLRRFETYNTAT